MRPAHLRATHRRVSEVMNQLTQKVRLRHKVSIEDGNQLAFRGFHAVLERARFESRAIVPMNVMNIETIARIFFDRRARDACGFISRIVKHLNFQTLARIIKLSYGLDQSLDHVHLVEQRQLYRDVRQVRFGECSFWLGWKLSIPPELSNLLHAVNSVDRQDREDAEVNNQHRPIKRIQLVKRADV